MQNFIRDESGQGMVEYGLILALIAVVVMLTLTTLGKNTRSTFQTVNDQMVTIVDEKNKGGKEMGETTA